MYQEEQTHLAEDLAQNIKSIERQYFRTIDERANKLATALEIIVSNNELISALKSHDRDALFKFASPIYQQLNTKHNITHFYFHDEQRKNILRLHQPNRFGDKINRFTTLNAERKKQLSHGVELGPLGTFTLRVVSPIVNNGKLLGYIELGEEVDQIIQDLKRIFNVELLVAINKNVLNKDNWLAGMNMLNRKAEWEHFPNVVIVSKTFKQIPKELISIFSNPMETYSKLDLEIVFQEQRYQGKSISLHDAESHSIGTLTILQNREARIQSTQDTIIFVSVSILIIGTFLFLLFYIILGRTERQLKGSLQTLQQSQFQLANAQRISHLGNWKYEIGKNKLECSVEASNIFGLESGDVPRSYEDLLTLVHPEDRDEFMSFIDYSQKTDDNAEIIHRIILPDGSIRIVRQHIEIVFGMKSEIIGINGTIQDITKLHQTEMRSARMGRILENSWNEIYAFDGNTLKFIEVSVGACQNLGYTMEEMFELTPLDLQPEFTNKQLDALLAPLRCNELQQVSFESQHHRKDNSRYPVEVRLQFSKEEKSSVFIAIAQDISERKRYLEELEHNTLFDTLTDLPNRILLQDRLQQALNVAHRETGVVAVFVVDVVRLREINDLLGHQNGDYVLKEVTQRLHRELRETDTISRIGGDEFVLVIPTIDFQHCHLISEKIHGSFEQPIIVEDTTLEVEATIGVALYPDHGDVPETLLQHADIAMRIAKNENRSYSVYNPKDDPFSFRRLKLHGELRQAITNKTMSVFYQPKVDIKTGKIISVEALSRWPHPTLGMIAPDDFIPMVEQSGLIRPFTMWVLEEAIKQINCWNKEGRNISIAVNLSTRNLLDPTLADYISELLQTYRVLPSSLVLEITESAVMSRPEHALKILMRLHNMEIKLSIDDFGTGYSSLAYLKRLPVSELKIDYSFVKDIVNDENDTVIVRSTIDLAHNLGMTVVAEGVENKEILNLLKILGCDIGQGYYFSRPLPIDQLTQWLIESDWGDSKTIRTGTAN